MPKYKTWKHHPNSQTLFFSFFFFINPQNINKKTKIKNHQTHLSIVFSFGASELEEERNWQREIKRVSCDGERERERDERWKTYSIYFSFLFLNTTWQKRLFTSIVLKQYFFCEIVSTIILLSQKIPRFYFFHSNTEFMKSF